MREGKDDSLLGMDCRSNSPNVTCGAVRVLVGRFIGRCRTLQCRKASGIVRCFGTRLGHVKNSLAGCRSSLARCGMRGQVVGCCSRAGRVTTVGGRFRLHRRGILFRCGDSETVLRRLRERVSTGSGQVVRGIRLMSGLGRTAGLANGVVRVRAVSATKSDAKVGLARCGGHLVRDQQSLSAVTGRCITKRRAGRNITGTAVIRR